MSKARTFQAQTTGPHSARGEVLEESLRSWRLNPAVRKTVLTVHVAASVALIGATASVLIVAARAAGAGPLEAHALYESAETMAFALAIPLVMASLVSGLTLGFGTPWGILRYYWVVAKLGLLIAVILTGSFAVGPLIEQLTDASATGLEKAALGDARWQVALAGAANLLFVAVAVVLAVFKPWGRIHLGRHAADEQHNADAISRQN